jgi:O-antigen ligase
MDRKKIDGISKAIWIPFIWIAIAGSRFVSHWLEPGTLSTTDAYMEGSPVDRAVFMLLILVGIVVLIRRRLNWGEIFKNNILIWLYFFFGLVSFIWSDYPLVSFKRWIKASGNIIMILIILTEERPYEALGVILRRFAFLLLPLSVLFIKYYPNLGRSYHMGMPLATGVSGGKNGLGLTCLLSGIYLCWNLLVNKDSQEGIQSGRNLHFSIYIIMLPMIIWLLYMANSATSTACLIVALVFFLIARQPSVKINPHRIMTICFGAAILFGILELVFDVKDIMITMLGRRPDLTSRVPMWDDLLSMVKNPIIGVGYESFWLGDRMVYLRERWGGLIQAHNGYIEMYLNMGVTGLLFLIGWILSGLRNIYRHLAIDYKAALLRFCFIIVVVLYNYTEAAFYGVNNMWIIFFLSIMDSQCRKFEKNANYI